MNVRGDTEKDRSEFWWKVVIYSVIGIVVVGALFNSCWERLMCPSATEREYIEFVESDILWFLVPNTHLEVLFKDLEEDPQLFMDDCWRQLVDYYAERVGRISKESIFYRPYPSSEKTELLQEYELGLRDHAHSASVHILQALETNDRDMLWNGNRYRIKAKASASGFMRETTALWPECSFSIPDFREDSRLPPEPVPAFLNCRAAA